jgi:hypothetical protein
MSWVAAIIFYNIASIGEVELSTMRLRGSVFGILEELEFVVVGLSSSRRRKKEERSKKSIKNLSETSNQKSKKSQSG